jgi:hypothetical protein
MEGEIMHIKYVLNKAQYDELFANNMDLNKVKSILQESKHYDHKLSIPMMVLNLIERERNLTQKLKELPV